MQGTTVVLSCSTYIQSAVCDQVQAKYNINSATSADLTEQMKSRAEKQTPRELVILPRFLMLMLTPLNSTLAGTDSTNAHSLTAGTAQLVSPVSRHSLTPL